MNLIHAFFILSQNNIDHQATKPFQIKAGFNLVIFITDLHYTC